MQTCITALAIHVPLCRLVWIQSLPHYLTHSERKIISWLLQANLHEANVTAASEIELCISKLNFRAYNRRSICAVEMKREDINIENFSFYWTKWNLRDKWGGGRERIKKRKRDGENQMQKRVEQSRRYLNDLEKLWHMLASFYKESSKKGSTMSF